MERQPLVVHVAVRLDAALVARLDAWCDAVRARTPGARITRSDGVRMLLERALKEEGHAKERGGRKGA
jgi:hypothetical protein